MKILMIGWGFKERMTGGMDVHITHLVKNLCSLGAEVHLFLPSSNTPDQHYPGLTIHSIDLDRHTYSQDILKLIKNYNDAIIKKSESLDFDMIHSHDWFGVLAAKTISKKREKPWTHTVHSLEHIRCGNDTAKKTDISDIEKTGIRKSNTIITVSNLMKNEIQQLFNVNEKKINTVYNYTSELPRKNQTNSKLDEFKDCQKILCVSRLTFQKGIEHLIYSAKDILKVIPECRFIIVGDGHIRKSLEEFTKILGIYDSFRFSGFVREDELQGYYDNSDIFIMPSPIEPFGIVCLDAIDFNVPVIISENVGAKELFPDCILSHKTRSSKSITENILKLLNDKDFSTNLKSKAKNRLSKIDNWNDIAKKVMYIYSSV